MVDGQPHGFDWKDGMVSFAVPARAGESRNITVRYRQTVATAPVNVARNSLRVYLLRMSSDFRDDVLYRFTPGRALIDAYYGRLAAWSVALAIGATGAFLVVVSSVCFLTLKRRPYANGK